jgi:signal transduction histidine kinase
MSEPAPFDREWTLDDLLDPEERDGLRRLFGRINDALGDDSAGAVWLADESGTPVAGPRDGRCAASGSSHPIRLKGRLEPVGTVRVAGEPPVWLPGIEHLLELYLDGRMRLKMAMNLHRETVQDEFETLKIQHRLLAESEARYRVLAESLEEQVAAQVADLDRARLKLVQQDRLAAVGRLAAGVAHEINTPIGFILSNLNTARHYVATLAAAFERRREPDGGTAEGEDLRALLEDFQALVADCSDGASRIAGLVSDLRGFTHIDDPNQEAAPVDLNEELRKTLHVAAPLFGDRVAVVTDFSDVPPLRCRPAHLNQAFLNLILNAVQAIRDRGTITIATLTAGGRIAVRITDTGVGIPEEIRGRLFEPFFTTKDVGEGRGLGLTVARDIVAAHGGTIDVDSRVGAGSAFTVALPITEP